MVFYLEEWIWPWWLGFALDGFDGWWHSVNPYFPLFLCLFLHGDNYKLVMLLFPLKICKFHVRSVQRFFNLGNMVLPQKCLGACFPLVSLPLPLLDATPSLSNPALKLSWCSGGLVWPTFPVDVASDNYEKYSFTTKFIKI